MKKCLKISEAVTIIKNEIACVKRAETCDRNCGVCDLVRDSDEIITAMEMAVEMLETGGIKAP